MSKEVLATRSHQQEDVSGLLATRGNEFANTNSSYVHVEEVEVGWAVRQRLASLTPRR